VRFGIRRSLGNGRLEQMDRGSDVVSVERRASSIERRRSGSKGRGDRREK